MKEMLFILLNTSPVLFLNNQQQKTIVMKEVLFTHLNTSPVLFLNNENVMERSVIYTSKHIASPIPEQHCHAEKCYLHS